jgi:hypothetical protein
MQVQHACQPPIRLGDPNARHAAEIRAHNSSRTKDKVDTGGTDLCRRREIVNDVLIRRMLNHPPCRAGSSARARLIQKRYLSVMLQHFEIVYAPVTIFDSVGT